MANSYNTGSQSPAGSDVIMVTDLGLPLLSTLEPVDLWAVSIFLCILLCFENCYFDLSTR